MNKMKTDHCRKCKAPIIFLPTKTGKTMPIDAGTVREDDTEYVHGRHTSHFATCPQAAAFRKVKA